MDSTEVTSSDGNTTTTEPLPKGDGYSSVIVYLVGAVVFILLLAALVYAVICLTLSQAPTTDNAADEIKNLADTEQLSGSWPNLFGPFQNSISIETDVTTNWPKSGPPLLWEQPIGIGYSSPILSEQKLVLFHRLEDKEIIECFDGQQGNSLWKFSNTTSYECIFEYSNGPYSTPAISDGKVYAIGTEGVFYCLSLKDGSLLWQRSLNQEFEVPENLFAVGHSPLVDEELVYLNLGGSETNSGIIALDKQTGKTIWQATDHGASYTTPRLASIHGKKYLFVFTEQGLVSLDPALGKVYWQIKFGVRKSANAVNAVSPLIYQDMVFLTAGPGPGSLCLKILPDGSYTELWRDRRVLDSQFNTLVCIDGFVYGYTSKRNRGATFNCLELATGELQWRFPETDEDFELPPLYRGTTLAVQDQFILFGEEGHLFSMDISHQAPQVRSYTEKPLLDAPTYSAPALVDGLLYLRNEAKVCCYDLRKK